MARRRKKRRKPFRVPAGFARKDLKSRVLYILHRQKGEPLEVNALEAQAQVKRDQHEDYVQLLSQMEQSGEIWRRRNSVALTDGQKFVKARIVSINEKFGFARPEPKEGEAPITGRDQDIYLRRKYMLGCMPGDVVMVRLVPQRTEGEKREGSVAKVLQPNQEPCAAGPADPLFDGGGKGLSQWRQRRGQGAGQNRQPCAATFLP